MENEFNSGGRKFKIGKINVIKQFHVARKITPLLGSALPAMKEIAGLEKDGGLETLSESEKLEKIAKVMTPFVKGIGELPDDEAEKVLIGLLSSVEVWQQDYKCWAKIANDKVIVMQDLNLPTLLQVAGRAFMFNLSGFFPAPQSQSAQG